MQSPTRKIQDINRLLAAYPPGNWTDPEQAMRGYVLAVDDYAAADVEAAVDAFIKGSAPGVNPSFVPPPAALGAEVRRQMNARLDHEARIRKPALPPPDIEKTPESRARVAAMVAGVVERTAEQLRTDEAAKAKAEQWAKTNARFMPDMDPDAMRQRLMPYTVGDPEDDRDAA